MRTQPATRSNQQNCDILRLFTTRLAGGGLPDFAGWSGYPSIAALSINPGIDVMYQKEMLPRPATAIHV
jgi:hypothetical protein